MRIVCISDTHSLHPYMSHDIPNGDILIHSGDCTNIGKENDVREFITWFQNIQGFSHKIFIAGNHDFAFEREPSWLNLYIDPNILTEHNVTYLDDGELEIVSSEFSRPIKIYGSPWQPEFYDWAFNLPRGEKLAEKWALIPGDTDILITHGPAHGMLDWTPSGQVVGCEDLFHRIMEVQPKIHVCGHIHCAYGQKNFNGVEFLNASVLNERYEYENKPIKIEFDVNDKQIVEYYD